VILTQDERDKPLSFHWRAALLLDALRLPPARKDRAVAQAAILLDALQEAHGAGRRISYSRNKNFYAFPRRYRLTAFTYRNVKGNRRRTELARRCREANRGTLEGRAEGIGMKDGRRYRRKPKFGLRFCNWNQWDEFEDVTRLARQRDSV